MTKQVDLAWAPVPMTLDDQVWRTWLARNRAQEERAASLRIRALTLTFAVLLLILGLLTLVVPFRVS